MTEQQIAGAGFLRVDIPGPNGSMVTQLVNPSSIYTLTPTTEEIARETAKQAPAPVSSWDLRGLLPKPSGSMFDNDEEEREDDDDWEPNRGLPF